MPFQPRFTPAKLPRRSPQRPESAEPAAFALEELEGRTFLSAPSIPASLGVAASTSSSITLRWTASVDDGEVTGYRIYRNGVKLRAAPSGTVFTDRGLSPATQYVYSIRAADDSGLFSRFSRPISAGTAGVVASNGFDVFSASRFNASSGVQIGSREINSLDDGDWVLYRNVQFGRNAASIRFNIARESTQRGGTIEIRLDGVTGTRIGRHEVQATGRSDAFITQYANVNAVSGTHDVYLVFRGGSDIGHLRSFAFGDAHLTRIMALGDSITHAFRSTPSYRWFLWHDLLADGRHVDFVGSQRAAIDGNPLRFDFDQDHEGHTGLRADELAAQARNWASRGQPEIVLLHAGSNDIDQGQSTDSTIDDLRNTITEIRAAVPGVTILLAKILPSTGHDDAVNDLNARIPGLASSLNSSQSRVIVVDANTGFSAADLQDGSHPTSAGESKLASRWFAALRNVL